MALNNAALDVAAAALRTALAKAQLHSAAAGTNGTSNVASASMQPVTWTSPTGPGNVGLATQMTFTGTPNGAVYSLTFWDSAGTTFYGEFVLTGEVTFDAGGFYVVPQFDLTGSAT